MAKNNKCLVSNKRPREKMDENQEVSWVEKQLLRSFQLSKEKNIGFNDLKDDENRPYFHNAL